MYLMGKKPPRSIIVIETLEEKDILILTLYEV